jgi:hypothetical protein
MDKSRFRFVGCLEVQSCLSWVSLYIRIMLTEFKKISGNSFSVGWHWASRSCSSMPSRWPMPRPDIILSLAALQLVACPSQNTLSIAENRFVLIKPIRISLVCFITVCQSFCLSVICLCLYASMSNWPSVCASLCLTDNLSVGLRVSLFLLLFGSLSVFLCFYYCLTVCLTGYLSVHLSVCLCISVLLLFGSLSNWLSVCESVCLYVSLSVFIIVWQFD